jgi:hypothetical protein
MYVNKDVINESAEFVPYVQACSRLKECFIPQTNLTTLYETESDGKPARLHNHNGV